MAFGFSLVDTAGSSHALDGSLGIKVPKGARGLGYPAITPAGDKLPYAPGVVLRRVSTAAGILELPLLLERSTQALLETLIDDLRGWVLPGTERSATPSTVRLVVTGAGGAVREIEGVATLDRGDDGAGHTKWQRYILTLYCQEAYWRDATPTVYEFTNGEGVNEWFPYWPYDVAPSDVFAAETVSNGGHIETWPVWTVTGPGSGLVLTNTTTGEVFELVASLGAGDVVTIDTSEGVKTVTDADDENLWPDVTAESEMWPLVKGTNAIQVALTGATGASEVEMSYQRRWAGGHR